MATVLLHIWPWMLIVTLASLYLLVLVAGLIGIYIFPALLCCCGLNYSSLWCLCKALRGERDVKRKVEQNPEDSEAGIDNGENKELVSSTADFQSFLGVAAVSSMYLPSVVGQQEQKIFLVSGMTSLASKILLLVLAVTLAASGVLIHKRPFLLFCVNQNSSLLHEEHVRECSFSEGNCFPIRNMTQEERFVAAAARLKGALEEYDDIVIEIDNAVAAEKRVKRDFFPKDLINTSTLLDQIIGPKSEYEKKLRFFGIGETHQKIRTCEDETPLRLGILVSLLVIVALAAYSTYKLHRIADYQVNLNI